MIILDQIYTWLFGKESYNSRRGIERPAIDWYTKKPVRIRHATKPNPYGLEKYFECRFYFLHRWVYITAKHPFGGWVDRICRRCGKHESYYA